MIKTNTIPGPQPSEPLISHIREYWNTHIHDLEIATHPVGSAEFFQELDAYRYDKLRYLPQAIDFKASAGQELLEIGCGAGIDLVRFAHAGARTTGVDLAPVSIELAKQNFAHLGVTGTLLVMNGESLQFENNSFDIVYAHGVIQYTANPQQMIDEIRRVVRPGGQVILMVYNRVSWLNGLSKLMNVGLEHEDAPVLRKYSIREFRSLLQNFSDVRIVPERFPVKTQLHKGLKAALFNGLFVPLFDVIPRLFVRPLGWHLMAYGRKQ